MGKIFRVPVLGTAISIFQDRHGSATNGKIFNGKGQYESQLFVTVIDKNGRERAPYEYFGNRKKGTHVWAKIYNFAVKAWYFLLYRKNTKLNLGTGLTTNVAAIATANDPFWANAAAANSVLEICTFHGTGTGSTAAAATDIKLTTNDAVALVSGTASLISAANSQKLQSVATLTGYGTEAVTEWGLHSSGTISATTGTPFTATSGTTATATGTPYTASSSTVVGQQFNVVVPGTTTVFGLVLSNTTSAFTIPAWYKVADGTAGSTPGTTEAFTIKPLLYDHKVFSAINTVSGDTIQFTYQLTIASGN